MLAQLLYASCAPKQVRLCYCNCAAFTQQKPDYATSSPLKNGPTAYDELREISASMMDVSLEQ